MHRLQLETEAAEQKARLREAEEVVGDAGADHMQAGIVGPRVAEAIAVKPGLMGRRAGL